MRHWTGQSLFMSEWDNGQESHFCKCRNETLDRKVIAVHVGMRHWTGKSMLSMSDWDTGQESNFYVGMRHWRGKSLLPISEWDTGQEAGYREWRNVPVIGRESVSLPERITFRYRMHIIKECLGLWDAADPSVRFHAVGWRRNEITEYNLIIMSQWTRQWFGISPLAVSDSVTTT